MVQPNELTKSFWAERDESKRIIDFRLDLLEQNLGSSLLSPQSLFLSQNRFAGIHRPFEHVNSDNVHIVIGPM